MDIEGYKKAAEHVEAAIEEINVLSFMEDSPRLYVALGTLWFAADSLRERIAEVEGDMGKIEEIQSRRRKQVKVFYGEK